MQLQAREMNFLKYIHQQLSTFLRFSKCHYGASCKHCCGPQQVVFPLVILKDQHFYQCVNNITSPNNCVILIFLYSGTFTVNDHLSSSKNEKENVFITSLSCTKTKRQSIL